jgi:hypothetical protein
MWAPVGAKTERRRRQCIRGAVAVPSPPTGGGAEVSVGDNSSNWSAAELAPQAPSPRNPAAIATRGADVFWQKLYVNG